MNQTPDIKDIANWFLAKEPVTHKKLQKLCYYAVAWGWTLMDKSIAGNDKFEAWVHGPVSPPLYEKYKDNGWNALPQPQSVAEVRDDVADLLESVWFTYGEKSGNELEALSHSETPWIKARAGLSDSEPSHNPIDTEEMKSFYASIKSTEF
jgi:uncharacterized phage-associated protein